MSRTIFTDQHILLSDYIASKRRAAGLTQSEVAKRLGRYQSFVANIETGQRRVDVVELLEIAGAIGFDPKSAIEHVANAKKGRSRLQESRKTTLRGGGK